MSHFSAVSFENVGELHKWLKAHHKKESELWVRIFKKATGIPSVSWNDCVIAALTWGWIDGQKRSLDEQSYLQRLTPRRPRSGWSKRNCEHAEKLIAEALMQPAGLLQVQAAKADGRWESAYAGQAEMQIPEDFLQELKKNHAAQQTFDALKRSQLFVIYHRLHTAKRPETKKKRSLEIIATLAKGESPK